MKSINLPKACQPVTDKHFSLNYRGNKFRCSSSCIFFPLSSFTHLSSSRLLQDGRQLELIPACSGLQSRHQPSTLVALLLNIPLCTVCSKTNGTEGIICNNVKPSLGTLVTDGLRGRPFPLFSPSTNNDDSR